MAAASIISMLVTFRKASRFVAAAGDGLVDDDEIGLFAVRDIREGEVVLSVPLPFAIAPHLLSDESSPLAAPVRDAKWNDQCIFTTVALLQLMWTTSGGDAYKRYLATIPENSAPNATWRGKLSTAIKDPSARAKAQERREYLESTVALLEQGIFPALSTAGVAVPDSREARERDVQRAYAAVLSRSIINGDDANDEPAACALVPVLDLFNHADDGAVVAQLKHGEHFALRVTATRDYKKDEEVHLTYDSAAPPAPFVGVDTQGNAPRCLDDWMLHFGTIPQPLDPNRRCATLLLRLSGASKQMSRRSDAYSALHLSPDGSANFTVRLGGKLPPALLPWARVTAATDDELERAKDKGSFRRPLDPENEISALDLLEMRVNSHLDVLGSDARDAALAGSPTSRDAAEQIDASAAMALLNLQDVLHGVKEWYLSSEENLDDFAKERIKARKEKWKHEAEQAIKRRGGEL
ncbi:N-lysine methyltransferase setd6 [Pycnococcus provasolii]|uniref:N-lysine methyltransferase setd6 n=1 Tax=Pycnococcus provasolii TaxID=41880 RepID=A0A830HN16_9CHLO|nr:N-lysine methyltransferase setd6 [Pycnococcus provasolii]